MEIVKNHSLSIENRKNGLVSGVEKVVSSNEKVLQLITSQGGLLISGNGFKIKRFSIEDGELSFEGEVDSFKYLAMGNGSGVLKKIFR
ncbi:MAG: sporulation protein YabP [Firmicutes bacterium]|nr:sporulation protein YabP [Bacillota bacterium]